MKNSSENLRRVYLYGFQNQERDDEIKGAGNSVNFKYRMHDPRLGRFFAVDPLSDNFAFNSPFSFSMNSVIKFKELEGMEIYVCGTYADEFVNFLSNSTGLAIEKNPNGLLTMKTEQLLMPNNIFSPRSYKMILVPKINDKNKLGELTRVTFQAITGIDNKGEKLSVVDIVATSSSEVASMNIEGYDNVLFDTYRSLESEKNGTQDMLDMSDFNAIEEIPAFSSALLGHVIMERMTNGDFPPSHQKGLNTEFTILSEHYEGIEKRDQSLMARDQYLNREYKKGNGVTTFTFDYKTLKFILYSKENGEGEKLNPNEVKGVIEIKQNKEDE